MTRKKTPLELLSTATLGFSDGYSENNKRDFLMFAPEDTRRVYLGAYDWGVLARRNSASQNQAIYAFSKTIMKVAENDAWSDLGA